MFSYIPDGLVTNSTLTIDKQYRNFLFHFLPFKVSELISVTKQLKLFNVYISKISAQFIAEVIKKNKHVTEKAYGNNLHPHHFHIRNYVVHQELTFHIKLDNHLSVDSGHKIATVIENKLYEECGIIATIHVEPKDFAHDSD